MDRSRNWIVNQAIEQFLATQTWQIEEIKKGIEEADSGGVFPHDQVMDRIEAKIKKVQS